MKHWTKFLFIFFFFVAILPKNIFAHPGNTAADGCHYCRTNCDRWGVAWNERHCHGSKTVETVQIVQPTSAPRPTSVPTKVPTKTPTVIPTNTPVPTLIPSLSPTATPSSTPTIEPTKTEEVTPTIQPQILGEVSTQKPSEPVKTSDTILGFSILGLIGFGIYKLFVKIKNKVKEFIKKK